MRSPFGGWHSGSGDGSAPTGVWRNFSLTAAQIADAVGYSDAGGAISREPNPAHALELFAYASGTLTAQFAGDVSAALAGRVLVVGADAAVPDSVGHSDGITTAEYSDIPLVADGVYAVAWVDYPVSLEAPTISGDGETGSTYTADLGTWAGADAYEYRWRRDGDLIAGAEGAEYISGSVDDGVTLSAEVRAQHLSGKWSAWAPTSNSIPVERPNTPPAAINHTLTYQVIAGEAPPATVPAAFTTGQWTVADKGSGGTVTVTVSTMPDDGGAAITALQYRVGSGAWAASGRTTAGSFDITGLTDDEQVSITLRAVNSVGNGPASDAKTATPTAAFTVPDVYQSYMWALIDTETGGTLRILLASVPGNGGSPITDVEYQRDGGAWVSAGISTIGEVFIEGLPNDTSVSVSIRAVNAAGPGPASDAKTATPTGGVEPSDAPVLIGSDMFWRQGGTLETTLPTHQTGDLLLLVVGGYANVANEVPAPDGWIEEFEYRDGTTASYRRVKVFSRWAVDGATPTPAVAGGNTRMVVPLVIRGARTSDTFVFESGHLVDFEFDIPGGEATSESRLVISAVVTQLNALDWFEDWVDETSTPMPIIEQAGSGSSGSINMSVAVRTRPGPAVAGSSTATFGETNTHGPAVIISVRPASEE